MFYIVIREQNDSDIPAVSEVVRNAYLSNVGNTFQIALLNEATMQIIVIIAAIQFIFFQIPFLFCLATIPIVLFLLYIIIYGAWTMKAAQIMYDKKPINSWVAEAYEPYFTNKEPSNCWYKIMTENEIREQGIEPEGRRKIIGTIAVMKHKLMPEWAWLFRLAIEKSYRRKGVGLYLVNTVKRWCSENRYNNVELTISECQEGARELFDAAGFETKQLYHKKLAFSVYMLQMCLLNCEVRPIFT